MNEGLTTKQFVTETNTRGQVIDGEGREEARQETRMIKKEKKRKKETDGLHMANEREGDQRKPGGEEQ